MNIIKIKKIIQKYSFILGFILLALIVSKLDFASLGKIMKEINYPLVVLALLIVIPTIFFRSWRWNYLKREQGINYKLKDSFLIYNIGFLVGIVTPGRIGEIIKIYYLKNNNCSTGKSLVSVVLDRLMDVFYLLIFGYLGIIFTLKELSFRLNLIYIVIALSVILIIVAIKYNLHKIILKKVFYKLIPEKYQEMWQENFTDFWEDLKSISLKQYFYGMILTTIGWASYYFQIYIFTKSMGIDIPIIHLSIAVTISGLITMLPISFLGIGTREATLLILLGVFVANTSSLVVLSQLILLANITGGIIGLIALKFKPLPVKL